MEEKLPNAKDWTLLCPWCRPDIKVERLACCQMGSMIIDDPKQAPLV